MGAALSFDEFLKLACPPLDLQWRKYRRRAARHRVRARMDELGLEEYGDYLSNLREDSQEASSLADLMRVTVSRFFRERTCWEKLTGSILADCLVPMTGRDTFRAWSAGCCGGEEPFTLAMLWRDVLAPSFPSLELAVTATDIDGASIERAAAALYSGSSLREVPAALRERWFHRQDALWRLDETISRAVEFKQSHLVTDPPPEKQDLVLCRYLVFTYYRGRRRFEAARGLFSALRQGGILFTGRKEGLGPAERGLFEPLAADCGIYRRRDA